MQFGWLLSFWNLAGVPFSYPMSILYMATRDPQTYRFPVWAYVLLVRRRVRGCADRRSTASGALRTTCACLVFQLLVCDSAAL